MEWFRHNNSYSSFIDVILLILVFVTIFNSVLWSTVTGKVSLKMGQWQRNIKGIPRTEVQIISCSHWFYFQFYNFTHVILYNTDCWSSWFNIATLLCLSQARNFILNSYRNNYVVVYFFCSMILKREVVVRFVNIGGTVYHHCLRFFL